VVDFRVALSVPLLVDFAAAFLGLIAISSG
jgi:hypothetical protein